MSTVLVTANVEDAEKIKKICINAFTDDYEQYGSYPPGILYLEWHKKKILTGHYYKILYENEIAGGIYLVPMEDDEMEVKYFFISKAFQNKKIGSETIKLIEKQYPKVKLWVLVTPYKAFRNHHFYEKLGYLKTGEIKPDPKLEFRLFKYKKEIVK